MTLWLNQCPECGSFDVANWDDQEQLPLYDGADICEMPGCPQHQV